MQQWCSSGNGSYVVLGRNRGRLAWSLQDTQQSDDSLAQLRTIRSRKGSSSITKLISSKSSQFWLKFLPSTSQGTTSLSTTYSSWITSTQAAKTSSHFKWFIILLLGWKPSLPLTPMKQSTKWGKHVVGLASPNTQDFLLCYKTLVLRLPSKETT